MKDIIGFEGLYGICNDGSVYSYRNKRYIKPYTAGHGYLVVGLHKDKKRYYRYIHILVAQHYIPNPDEYPQVNHKDGDKLNCNDWNLEWSTCSDNIKHAFDIGLNKFDPKGKKVFGKKIIDRKY